MTTEPLTEAEMKARVEKIVKMNAEAMTESFLVGVEVSAGDLFRLAEIYREAGKSINPETVLERMRILLKSLENLRAFREAGKKI